MQSNYLRLSISICLGVFLRLFCASDGFLHLWDERYHALVAKNLMIDFTKPCLYSKPLLPYEVGDWAANHIWLSKPPVALWLISLSYRCFGVNEYATRFPSLILSVLSIFFLYRLAKLLFNENVAQLSAFLFAIHGLLVESAAGRSSSDHIDTALVFFVLVGVLCTSLAVTHRSVYQSALVGVCMALAFLTKWQIGLLIAPLFVYALWVSNITSKWRHALIFAFVFFVFTLPWLLYLFITYPIESNLMFFGLAEPGMRVVQGHGGPAWFYLDYLRIQYGEIVYIPLVWFVYRSIKNPSYRMIALWFLLPVIIFSIAATKRDTYLLVASPAIFIVTAIYFEHIRSLLAQSKYKFLLRLILVLLIVLPLRYCIERIKPLNKSYIVPVWVSDLKAHKAQLNDKSVLFQTPEYVEAMFYTDCIAYPQVPNQATVDSLSAQGFEVFVNMLSSSDASSLKGVKHIKIRGR
jgi:4-amino-4-deoxy-L-arabinose transferase-like glycosyltransferase